MKYISALLFALLLGFSAFGQIDRDSRGISLFNGNLKVGPKVGINVANASFDDNDRNSGSSRVRLRAGAFVEIGISDAFALQPELLYSAKGFEEPTSFSRERGSNESDLDYLSIPIIAKYALFDDSNLQVTGQAGPYFGILLSAESDGRDVANSYSSLDVGGQVGIGAAYRIGPGSITLDIRAGFGLTDIFDLDFSGIGPSATNQTLPSATVGYAFSL